LPCFSTAPVVFCKEFLPLFDITEGYYFNTWFAINKVANKLNIWHFPLVGGVDATACCSGPSERINPHIVGVSQQIPASVIVFMAQYAPCLVVIKP
jgi:hypothetical protein